MRNIYSVRFCAVTQIAPGSSVFEYTVPAGKVALLTDVNVRSASTGWTYTVGLVVNPGSVLYLVLSLGAQPANTPFTWRGKIIANAGDKLRFYNTGGSGTATCIATGILLTA